MSSLFKIASETFSVEIMLDLIFKTLGWLSNVSIVFLTGLSYS